MLLGAGDFRAPWAFWSHQSLPVACRAAGGYLPRLDALRVPEQVYASYADLLYVDLGRGPPDHQLLYAVAAGVSVSIAVVYVRGDGSNWRGKKKAFQCDSALENVLLARKRTPAVGKVQPGSHESHGN